MIESDMMQNHKVIQTNEKKMKRIKYSPDKIKRKISKLKNRLLIGKLQLNG
jgi:hypothetical protein